MSRNSPNGSTYQWRRLRGRKLALYMTCEMPGCHRRSSEVDHIVPLKDWPEGRYVWSNLRALCWTHHKLRHGARAHDPETGIPLGDHWWNN